MTDSGSDTMSDVALQRTRHRRIVGVLAAVVMVVVLAAAWLITGPIRTAGHLAGIVGHQWVLAQVSHSGQTAQVVRRGDHTLKLQADGLISIYDGCNTSVGNWSWSLRGFDVDHAANGAVYCGEPPGAAPERTDPLIVSAVQTLYGSVTAALHGSALVLGSGGYTLTYVEKP